MADPGVIGDAINQYNGPLGSIGIQFYDNDTVGMAIQPHPPSVDDGTGVLLTRDQYEAWRKEHPEYDKFPPFPEKTQKSPLNVEGPKKGNNTGKLLGPVAQSSAPAAKANPPVEAETPKEKGWWGKFGGWVHTGLDVAGAIPVVGAVFDGSNALIYAAEGDLVQAGISGGAAALDLIPVVGDAGKVAELGTKAAVKIGEEVVEKGGEQIAKNAEKKLAEEEAEAAAKAAAEKKAEEEEAEAAAKKKKEEEGGKVNGLDKCTLRPYKPDTCKAEGKTGHHVVADRAFRLPGNRTGSGRKQIPGGLSEGEGLVICLEGKDRSGKTEHAGAHALYDAAELALGLKGNPPGTTELWKLEAAGAAAAAAVTKCNPAKLMAQLRLYHQAHGMGPDFKVRADPTGGLTKGMTFKDLMSSGAGAF